MKVFHQGLILVGVPLLIELLLIGNLWMLLIQADKERIRENRYRQFSALGARLMALTYEAPYLLLTSLQVRDQKLIKAYENDIAQIGKIQKQLRQLATDDPLVEDTNKDLQDSLEIYMGITQSIADARGTGNAFDILGELPKLQARFSSAKDITIDRVSLMVRIGQRSVNMSEKRMERVRFLQNVILSVGLIANLIIGALLLYFYRKQIMNRIGVIKQNTFLLTERKPLAMPLSGYDEIAQLDHSFHAMDTELKDAAEREQALFNNASDVICVLDRDYKFTKINPACTRLWHYQQDEMLKSDLLSLVPPEQVEKAKQALEAAKSNNEPTKFELELQAGNKVVLETLWSTYWSKEEHSLYCVVHDITERKNLERMKQQYLSMISSDLKRPLNSISKSLLGLIAGGTRELTAIAKDKLAVAEKNVLRLLGLVNDLLQIAEMESGHLEINRIDCTVEDLLRRSVQDVEVVAQKQGVKIELHAKAKSWYVDPDRIMQVLVNLLSNAIKFSPAGATITLNALEESDSVRIQIIDQGRGVPAKFREAIFEKFKQVEAQDGKRKAGTGLGLPICKQIIEEHGGTIGVDSEEGKGSTFWFNVPLSENSSLRPSQKYLEPAISNPAQPIYGEFLHEQVHGRGGASPPENPANAKSPRQLNLSQKGFLLIGIPILFEFIFVGVISLQLNQTDHYRQGELKQRRMAAYASHLLQEYLKSAFLITATKNEDNWIATDQCYRDMLKTRRDLQLLVKDDDEARKHFARVEEYNKKTDEFYRQAEQKMGDSYSPQKHDKAFDSRSTLLPVTAGVARRLQALIHDAEKREFHPELQAQQRTTQAEVLLAGLATSVMISILLALYFSRDMSSRLATLADNAERLAKEQPLNQELGGNDEIAELDRAFHQTASALDAVRKKERAVFDNSQDLICALDSEGHFLSSNPACLPLLGYEKEELLRKNVIEITAEEDKESTKSILLESSAKTHRSLENRLTRKDNSQVYILWSASEDQDGKKIYAVAHDISSRKELEQLKQEFLAIVSHDLRTPLTSITGIAKLMMAGAFGTPEQDTEKVLESITAEGDNLLELINDLLDIEKLEAGKMQLVIEKLSVRDLLEKSLAITPEAKRDKIELDAPEPDLAVAADKDRIMQAFGNLLNHALNRQTNGGSIKVSVENLSDSLEIDVQVGGPPLSESVQRHMFERFKEPLGEGASDDQLSRGLGLPIAKHIVESHGGTVGVRVSEDEHANVYWLRLPKCEV